MPRTCVSASVLCCLQAETDSGGGNCNGHKASGISVTDPSQDEGKFLDVFYSSD